ncbi:MAG: M24 family metallopeptidase [Streptosporangiales bacterium]
MVVLRIEQPEIRARRQALFDAHAQDRPQAAVIFSSAAAFYLSGFAFIATERPLALVLSRDEAVAFVPQLEREHVQATAIVDRVATYPDYPGDSHPMESLTSLVREMTGTSAPTLLVDAEGYASPYGYRGPKLPELLPDAVLVRCAETLEQLRYVKSSDEQALLRESSRWSDITHRYLQDGCADGANETDVSLAASRAGMAELVAAHGDAYDPRSPGGLNVVAGFRSQIGPNSAFPHAIPKDLTMHTGDVLVTGASALVWGYKCELERTMVLGEPTPEQRRFFSLMVGAQETAFEALRPGARCSDVDGAVRAYFDEHGITEYWRHHTGHGLGTQIHEGPFLDVGDHTVLEPGMVFSIEPGLYVPGLAGFRHSDTALVTDDGAEYLTTYPRGIEDLLCAT